MQDTVVLDGYLSLEIVGNADCTLVLPESAESGVFIAMRDAYPAYAGPTEITPSDEEQVLDTELKSVLSNIVIKPVETYTGEYVVDPKFSDQVVEAKNKMMLDDITVNAIKVARTSNPSGGQTVYIGGVI